MNLRLITSTPHLFTIHLCIHLLSTRYSLLATRCDCSRHVSQRLLLIFVRIFGCGRLVVPAGLSALLFVLSCGQLVFVVIYAASREALSRLYRLYLYPQTERQEKRTRLDSIAVEPIGSDWMVAGACVRGFVASLVAAAWICVCIYIWIYSWICITGYKCRYRSRAKSAGLLASSERPICNVDEQITLQRARRQAR